MTVELRPLGVRCNIQCLYCYQDPQRDADGGTRSYDLEKMKEAVLAEGGPFTLFGGEPLLLPLEDLEELWAWGYERFGRNSLQTNGTLITDRHMELFERYCVDVGISMDGPEELNDARWQGTLERTRAATRRTEAAIDALCSTGRQPSVIITLHRTNASADRMPRLLDWIRDLDRKGVLGARLHVLEVERQAVRDSFALTTEEYVAALLALAHLQRELTSVKFDLFSDIERMMLGDDRSSTCVWNACDPYTTEVVRGVEGNGRRTNCGRTNKHGVDFVKADRPGYERYLALYQTPYGDGGCRGCRFFLACKGQCPGTALGDDWRNRTEHCELWQFLFAWTEQRLLARGSTPISLSPMREALESAFVRAWSEGRPASMAALLCASRPSATDWRSSLEQLRRDLG